MNIQRGFRDKLEKYLNPSNVFDVDMSISGGSVYDFSCFGVDANNKLSDDRYMIFYNQTSSPSGEIKYSGYNNGAKFSVNLSSLPESINKLVFTANIDGSGTMSEINSHSLIINYRNEPIINMTLNGSDFNNERAIISIEIYRKDGWRIAAVANGFNGGLGDLLKFYGGQEIKTPTPAPEAPRKPVELRKGQKVNLQKKSKVMGEISINLNWHQGSKSGGLFSVFSSKSNAIDLDLGCLFEFKNGLKGSVQALGNTFGSLDNVPYIALDGDDRTGAVEGGETLRINGAKI